jgi:Bacterial Ig-like domain (group 1)
MRKLWSTLTLLTITATLAACGGGDNAFVTPGANGSGPGTASVAKMTVAAGLATLPPDGTTTTITATTTDANNVAVAGASVTFATSAGTLAVTAGTTGATGQATATLSAKGVAAGTVITITATSGGATGKTTVTAATTSQTLTLSTSVPQITSASGSPPAMIKALVVDANNNVVPGTTVNFQATSGALTVTQAVTDATGTAIATLGAGTNQQNRSITVTATAGTSTATINVAVVGTTLTVSGPTSLVQGATGTYTISLTDSGSNGISGQPVTLTSATGNALAPTSVTTGANGTASTVLTATSSGKDTVTATWLGMTGSQQVVVSGQNFAVTAPAANALVQVGTPAPVTFTWTVSGAGQTGTVYVTTSRGTVTPASVTVTGGTPSSPITVTSTTAGPATVSATAVQSGVTVATAQVAVNFVATTPANVSIQASPSAVAISGQSTLIATVIDAAGNPVLGATVNFTIQQDTTGGSLSAPTAVTNAQGQATVTYDASNKSSTVNGVIIEASVQGTGISSTTTLTVGGQTVFLSLGTGNTISDYAQGDPATQYELPYSIQAVDSAGHGLTGVTITFSVQSVAYAMGFYTFVSPSWTQTFTANNCKPTQVEEYNGVINPTPPPVGVTPVLTTIPGSVAATDVSSASTATGGTAQVNLIYPKDHAFWVQVALTATATVQGTQNSTTATFWLPGLATDYTNQAVMPPGQTSPYGENATCY